MKLNRFVESYISITATLCFEMFNFSLIKNSAKSSLGSPNIFLYFSDSLYPYFNANAKIKTPKLFKFKLSILYVLVSTSCDMNVKVGIEYYEDMEDK